MIAVLFNQADVRLGEVWVPDDCRVIVFGAATFVGTDVQTILDSGEWGLAFEVHERHVIDRLDVYNPRRPTDGAPARRNSACARSKTGRSRYQSGIVVVTSPQDYIEAARVPRSVEPQEFGLWRIERIKADLSLIAPLEMAMGPRLVGFPDYTLLRRYTIACEMGKPWEIVMEDSRRELRKHLPIWMAARGRVLVTGLGLGCVVRGLLANRDVDRIEVVEIDHDIIRIIGREFAGNARVGLTMGDALNEDVVAGRFDFAWHDLWQEDDGLQLTHAQLFENFGDRCGPQGAWAFPREFARLYARLGIKLLGAPRYG